MKYIDEFRNKNLIKKVSRNIKAFADLTQDLKIMEVCGTHTQSFYRFGLDKILPSNLRFISGPGCPVCVSTQEYIDTAIRLAQQDGVIIISFGDMLRVPGTRSTLEKERARYSNVRVVYSALDALSVAKLNPDKRIVFLAVGFETTAPTIALSIISAKKENLKNIFFFSSLKLIPPAISHLAQDKRLDLNGFLCPGHVSAIIGTAAYEFIVKRYQLGCCIAGFEPLDILEGIYLLLKQVINKKPKVENQYSRVVTRQGNSRALDIINKVFRVANTSWRGLGEIPDSGLKIRNEFLEFDAEREFHINYRLPPACPASPAGGRQAGIADYRLPKCRCGDVLKGLIFPAACPLFSKTCQPDNPLGPCMVSSEGACNAYYKYR